MDLELSGKQVLITGASKGIGLEIAHAFAVAGAHVHLVSRDEALLDTVAQEIRQKYKV